MLSVDNTCENDEDIPLTTRPYPNMRTVFEATDAIFEAAKSEYPDNDMTGLSWAISAVLTRWFADDNCIITLDDLHHATARGLLDAGGMHAITVRAVTNSGERRWYGRDRKDHTPLIS